LRADGHVFARGHGHRASDETGHPGDQNAPARGLGGGDPDDQAGGGENAIIGAQNSGAQPADSLDRVTLDVARKSAHGWFDRCPVIAAPNSVPAPFQYTVDLVAK
jgi:hypothetical protein